MKVAGSRERLGQAGFTILDTLVTLSLIGILIWVVIPRYERVAVEAQKTALRVELGGIRMTLQLYHFKNGRYPADLRDMLKEKYLLPTQEAGKERKMFEQAYLETRSLDAEGYILDPFGSRVGYDPKTGRVWSRTKGYEDW